MNDKLGDALAVLAEKLGKGTAQLWPEAVRSVMVSGAVQLGAATILLAVTVYALLRTRRWLVGDARYAEEVGAVMVAVWVGAAIMAVIVLACTADGLNMLLTPEGYLIRQVLR